MFIHAHAGHCHHILSSAITITVMTLVGPYHSITLQYIYKYLTKKKIMEKIIKKPIVKVPYANFNVRHLTHASRT